jgi:hypothetical protein
MNSDMITGPLRAIIPPLTAWAASAGYIPAGDYTTPLVSVITGIMVLWSIWTNRPSTKA